MKVKTKKLNNKIQYRILNFCKQHVAFTDKRHRHFTFICRRSTILSVGFSNKHRTHTMAARWFKYNSIHSEFDAIRKVKNINLHGSYVVNVRLAANSDVLAMSCPCKFCQKMLKELGICSVFYSSGNGNEFNYLTLPIDM